MIKVYGCSDDLVEVEGAPYPADEIGCFERDVVLKFKDGTVARVGYPKVGVAVWWIRIEKAGSAEKRIEYCNDQDAEIYSDVLYIDSELESYEVVRQ